MNDARRFWSWSCKLGANNALSTNVLRTRLPLLVVSCANKHKYDEGSKNCINNSSYFTPLLLIEMQKKSCQVVRYTNITGIICKLLSRRRTSFLCFQANAKNQHERRKKEAEIRALTSYDSLVFLATVKLFSSKTNSTDLF